MTTTTTAIMETMNKQSVRIAMARLLHGLRDYMRAHPIQQDDQMPEHDIDWVTGVGHGPETVIANAIKMEPELWAHALPADVVIVPRNALLQVSGLTSDAVDYLAGAGMNMVANKAAMHIYEARAEEEKKRYMERT